MIHFTCDLGCCLAAVRYERHSLTLSLSVGIAVTSVYYRILKDIAATNTTPIYRLSLTFEITLERSSLRVRRRLGVRKAEFFSRNADTVITRFTRGERLTDTVYVYTVRRTESRGRRILLII